MNKLHTLVKLQKTETYKKKHKRRLFTTKKVWKQFWKTLEKKLVSYK